MPATRVLIDLTAVPADRGGVGRYVDGVVAALEGELVLVCQARDRDFYRELAPTATILPQNPRISVTPVRLVWEQFVLPLIARRARVDVIHSPHYTLPLLSRRPKVVTFHDATFFSDPGVHTPFKRIFFTAWIRISARLANVVVVPSEATATELSRYVARPPGYIVAYHGVDETVFHPPTAQQLSASKTGLQLGDRPWIAFLGTIEPRKNVPALVRAYRSLVAGWHAEWGDIPVLALAGGAGWETDLARELALVRPPATVRQLGFVDIGHLDGFLGGSLFVVYPSLGEGFGLPVLEAMSTGTAVLTTDRLALPEVGGTAVAYTGVDSTSIEEGMQALIADAGERERLAAAGLARSRDFTWARSARTHELAYAQAALTRMVISK